MEESLKNVVFSKDFVAYALESCGYCDKRPKKDYSVKKLVKISPFRENIGIAVRYLYDNNKDGFCEILQTIEHCHDPLFITVPWLSMQFCNVFKRGYSPYNFLHFCTLLTSLISRYHLQKWTVVLMIEQFLSSVLDAFILTGEFKEKGGWKGLYDASEDVLVISEANTMANEVDEVIKKVKNSSLFANFETRKRNFF